MLRYILSLTVLFTVSQAQSIIPGAGLVMRGFSILDPENSVSAQIVDLAYVGNKLTPEGKYKLPDNFYYADQRICRFQADTITNSNYETLKDSLTSQFTIEGSYKQFTGSFSPSIEQIRESMKKYSSTVSYTESKCFQYSLGYTGASLANWFVAEINKLPLTYNAQSKASFQHFFNQYGDHVMTQCNVGGVLKQTVSTNTVYAKTNTQQKITDQAKATFYVTVDHSATKDHTVENEFETSSSKTSIAALGGDYPDSTTDNFNSWAKSIQALSNVACTHWKAAPISDFLKWNPDTLQRKAAMEQALADWFKRPGCTDPRATNYNPKALQNDNSCKLPQTKYFRLKTKDTNKYLTLTGKGSSFDVAASAAQVLYQEPFKDSYGKGNWNRFVFKDTNWCMDRPYCHWGDSYLRMGDCHNCGAKHWELKALNTNEFYLAEDDNRNCIYNYNGTPYIHHCSDGLNQVFIKEWVYSQELLELEAQGFLTE